LVDGAGIEPVVIIGAGDPFTPRHKQTKIASCGLPNRPRRSDHGGVSRKIGGKRFDAVAINDNHMFDVAVIVSEASV